MKRVLALAALFVCGFLAANNPSYAQNAPAATVAAKDVKVLDYKKVRTGSHSVTVKQGDSLSLQLHWTADPGLFDPIPTTATIAITDGKAGAVIEKDQVISGRKIAKDTLEVFHFDALRKGTAEITFTNTLSKKVIAKITVTVD